MNQALPSGSLPPEILAAVKVLCTRIPQDSVGPAVKTLRQHAGLSQAALAKRFSRQRTAVTNWENTTQQPPLSMTIDLLKVFGIPKDAIPAMSDGDLTLRSDAYSQNDPDIIEFQWIQSHRGQVLQTITRYAIDGSFPHGKLFKEWMRETEARIAARESRPIQVNSHLNARKSWQTGIPAAVSTSLDVGVQAETQTESLLCDTVATPDIVATPDVDDTQTD